MVGWLFSRLVGEDTRYASGYTGRAFRQIGAGMSKEEVLELLGPPLGHGFYEPDRLEIWRYSLSPSDDSYRVRVVQFRDGLVIAKVHELYAD